MDDAIALGSVESCMAEILFAFWFILIRPHMPTNKFQRPGRSYILEILGRVRTGGPKIRIVHNFM